MTPVTPGDTRAVPAGGSLWLAGMGMRKSQGKREEMNSRQGAGAGGGKGGTSVSLFKAAGLILMGKVSREMTRKRNRCHYKSATILYQLFPAQFPALGSGKHGLISFTSPFNFIGKRSQQCIMGLLRDMKGDPCQLNDTIHNP